MKRVETFIILALTVFSFIFEVSGIVGGRFAAVPPFNDPVVFVNHVGRFARVEGHQDLSTGLYTFRGIKYAEPPVRENRFLRPRSKRLSGDLDARRNAPPCPQPAYYGKIPLLCKLSLKFHLPADENKIIGDEDCLALNIFTPQMPDETSGLPVLLWIHGGGFRYGSAAQYGAEPLSSNHKIVFVPIQYRLGTLGILGDGSKEFGGNVAMFDMHAALLWVQEYISFFGGDPKQIKVVGHGSGAQSAMHLSSSPMGRSSINGVVAMSGSSLSQYSYDDNATSSTEQIATAHKCPHKDELELLKCMRNKSVDEIVKRDSDIQVDRLMGRDMLKSMNGLLSFSPNVESKDDQRGLPGFMIEKPEESLKKEPEKKIPLLIGVTKHETANAINTNEIVNIFKSGTEFLKLTAKTLRLNSILSAPRTQGANFLKALGSILFFCACSLNFYQLFVGLPTLDEYLTVPDNVNPEKLLAKFIESTTDVFFNVPSVLTADLWGKHSQAFFYQFNHVASGEASGTQFLKPLPLVSKGRTKGMTSHGDELGFLFDAHDVFGNKINESSVKSSSDEKVRKNFMELITRFAYLNATNNEFKLHELTLSPFRTEGSNFIQVSEKVSLGKDFRFCQLSLLGAPLQASQKITCEFLSENLKKLSMIPNVKDLGGLLGGGGGNNKKKGLL